MPGKLSCNKDEKYEEACVLKCFFYFLQVMKDVVFSGFIPDKDQRA